MKFDWDYIEDDIDNIKGEFVFYNVETNSKQTCYFVLNYLNDNNAILYEKYEYKSYYPLKDVLTPLTNDELNKLRNDEISIIVLDKVGFRKVMWSELKKYEYFIDYEF